ncbi:hypothetical protein BD769DRAFT_1006549 [Suillus cothurnatus]|nr:hypothetical protein BD769DRAFT_1006549 [Suillus cothurnatus]
MHSLLPTLNSTKEPNLIPQRLRVHVQIRSWIYYLHSSNLNLTPVKKSNSREVQCILMLWKYLQCGTGRSYLSLSQCHGIVDTLGLMVLPHQVEDLRIHYPSECWPISCFLSVARLNNLMTMCTQHSSSKFNRKVQSRLRLSPVWHRRPQDLLLLILVLGRHVQQPRSCAPFHRRLVFRFVSAVHLPSKQMGINTAAYRYFLHPVVLLFHCSRREFARNMS